MESSVISNSEIRDCKSEVPEASKNDATVQQAFSSVDNTTNNDVSCQKESSSLVPEDNEQIILETVDITLDRSGGVMKKIIKEGEGDECPSYGDRVFVHYTGWLLTKEKPVIFGSNRKDEKLEFNMGRGVVIKGWDLGVSTMKKGEIALFIIQPQYGYGDMGNPPTIPPHTPLLFEIELYDWKLDDISPKKDGSILRKVLEKGEEGGSPNDSALVRIKLIGYFEDKIFEECEKEFILGEGCSANVVEGVQLALFKFHLKEKSMIYLKSKYGFGNGSEEFNIPSDASIMYEITLISFDKAKDVWEMNTDEKFEKAKISKEKGIAFIQDKQWKAALRQFRWVLSCLEKEPGVDPETKEDRNNLLLSSYLNVTLCLLKLENYVDAIKFCDKALEMDSKNEKAIFRRGQARMHMNDCQEALENFNKILVLYPENKAAKQCIVTCQDRMKQQSVKDKSTYNNMFEKFVKQDAEKLKNMKTETGVWEEPEEDDGIEYLTEDERLLKESDSFLRDANIIELSNTAIM